MVETYLNDIRKVIFTYVKDYHMVEDITQEVFLTVFHKLKDFRGESSMKTWILKIAINKSKDYLKSWNYRKVQLTSWLKEEPGANEVERTVMNKLQNHELAETIMKLPLKYREVVILYYYHDFDTNEISFLLNLNVNTVKTRLLRSKDLLKRRFDFNE
ncbi:hypothetical protein A8F94_15045 [Bacillus sp. FJAT-27225]|nr:hypothetical protein A8F94_15045 [Bacillus sp. FJAT-27225]